MDVLPAQFGFLYVFGALIIAMLAYMRFYKIGGESREIIGAFMAVLGGMYLLASWYTGVLFVVGALMDYVMWIFIVVGMAYGIYEVAKQRNWIRK